MLGVRQLLYLANLIVLGKRNSYSYRYVVELLTQVTVWMMFYSSILLYNSCGNPIRRMRVSFTVIDYNTGAACVGMISGRVGQ